jgi:uncharacterized protein (TIGR02996 family)
MNEELGLLKDIIENPDDDTPRLRYADWLEGHGQPERAELIRGQVALASMSLSDPRHDQLGRRNSQLLYQHGDAWAAPFTGPGVREVHFNRGFVEKIEATATAFARRGAAWAAATPLREVKLTEAAGEGARLAACPHLAGIRRLKLFDTRLGDADVVPLAHSIYLTRLRELYIGGSSFQYRQSTMVGDDGLVALATSPFFRQLTSLTVYSTDSDGSIGSAGTASLAGAPVGSKLRRLDLRNTRIADPDAIALAGAAGLQGLVELGIDGGRIGTEGLVALLRSPHFRNLFQASFTANRVTPEVMHALAEADLPPTPQYLTLSSNSLADIDIDVVGEVLRRHPGLHVGLVDCGIPRGVQEELARRFPHRLFLDYFQRKAASDQG